MKTQNSKLKTQKYFNSPLASRLSPLSSGFTLIEVLVAATIIGLLATVGVGGFQTVTKSGRDGLRKSDLEQIRSALEIYKSENNFYPAGGSCSASSELVPNYISPYPADPKSPTYQYCYSRDPVTSLKYVLCAHLENGSTSTDYDCNNGGESNDCTSNCNYRVTNP